MGPDGEAANRAPIRAARRREPEYGSGLAVFAVVCSELTANGATYAAEILAR
jgi:hypothetical protein